MAAFTRSDIYTIFLPLIALNIVAVWGIGGVYSGLGELTLELGKSGILPASVPLKRRYLGIPGVDDLISNLVLFFWGSTLPDQPAAYWLFNEYFLVNGTAALAVILIEGSRRSYRNFSVGSPLLWGSLIQLITFGVGAPVWALFALLPLTTTPASTIPAREAKVILPALFGFWIPSAALAYRTSLFESHDANQVAIAVFQAFPLYVSVIAGIFRLFLGEAQPESTSDIKSSKRHLSITYKVASIVSAIGHVKAAATIFLSPQPWALFKDAFIPNLAVSKVDLAGQTHLLLNFDLILGFLAFGVFAYFVSPKGISVGVALASLVLLGPGYTLLYVLQERDIGRQGLHRTKSKGN